MIVRNIFHLIRRAGIEVWPVWESEWLTHGRNVNRLAGAVGLASVASGGHIRMAAPASHAALRAALAPATGAASGDVSIRARDGWSSAGHRCRC